MYFNKIHHHLNFRFARTYRPRARSLEIGDRRFGVELKALGEDVFRLDVTNRQWRQYSQAELSEQFDEPGSCSLSVGKKGALELRDGDKKIRLATGAQGGFGVCGKAWMWKLAYSEKMHFYGMGEKGFDFERSRQRTKFWNTDVWADFHYDRIINGVCDPLYCSIPYLVIEQDGFYVGILVNNPFAVFMATNPQLLIAEQNEADEQPDSDLYLGAPDGLPSMYIIAGPSLAELTRKLQRLCGTTPRPPVWALGHHQSRWGYRSPADLEALADEFEKHRMPCSALWLDIDYMRGYRVFSWHPDLFPNVSGALERIRKRGYRVVPIIDPGVKRDSRYAVYRDGLRNHAYCLNKEGKPYVGFVWPGASVFPDYSKPEARDWWAKRVARFAADGIEGVWIDMNDPSTGASEVEEMRFHDGKDDHATYHNQYALGMAKATRAGLQQAHPETRPFVITRSGYTSINRYAAVWTGDNFSNEHHLKMSIPTSLNLALSGVPFNGPDVPGFCGNADGPLLSLWYRAGFLFPFFRNHAAWDTVRQEPWTFGKKYLQVARHYTRLRYKLMPYLYNLFIEQEQTGEAIMRPMLYDFKSRRGLSLARVGDQFMMGPALLHAPLQERGATRRDLVLPHGAWFDAMHGRWIKGGRTMQVPVADDATPLFIRDGSAVPMQRGMPVDGNVDLARIEMHLFMSPTFRGTLTGRYCFDDGETLAYQEGQESDLSFSVRVSKGEMTIRIEQDMRDRPCRLSWVLYRKIKSVRLHVDGNVKELALKPYRWRFTGKDIQAYRTEEVMVE